ncbi:glycosyltransferase family 87 protein [Albidovulum sp.]|uniref:glycosyltransferase family 87 protein n=1 Tax=Albidovulum sp. TaxID=1872424 RepID=UPI0025B8EE43|nr:glycosyltransferase family 87 protein [Defluviimonas sp.]
MDIARALAPYALTPSRDRAFALAMLGFWALVTTWQQWGRWAEDLSAVYMAGWLWHSGQGALIYDAPPAFFGGAAESWLPAMQALGIAGQTTYAYVYPPLWAVLAAPLAGLLSPQGFLDLAAAVQIPMLAASAWLAGRILKPAAMPWWVWSAIGLVILNLSIQSHLAIWQNQPTITVGFLTLLAFERLGADRPVAAGVALALAAAIKLTPAAFVLVFLLDGQRRAVLAFALAGAALGLLSIALAGWPAHQAFLASLALVKGVAFLTAVNTSLFTAAVALGSTLGHLPMPPVRDPLIVYQQGIPLWLSPAITLLALALLAAFARVLRPLSGTLRRGLGLIAVSIIVALLGPLGWLHYYLVPLLLLPGFLALLPLRQAAFLAAFVGLPSLSFVFPAITVLPWPIADYTWIMCAAWAAVLAGIFAAARRARA